MCISELQAEVQDYHFDVPPVVMSHCLRFLCYHHLHNIVNRQQSLRDLYLTIKEKYFVSENRLSDSLTILGVCNEIVGDKKQLIIVMILLYRMSITYVPQRLNGK